MIIYVGMRRCIEFWVTVLRLNEDRLLKVVMLEALERGSKIEWVQNLKQSLEMFGWGQFVWKTSEVCRWGGVRNVLMDVAWREVRGGWKKEGSHSVLGWNDPMGVIKS